MMDLKHDLTTSNIDGLASTVRSIVAGIEFQHIEYILKVTATFEGNFVDISLFHLILWNAELYRILGF